MATLNPKKENIPAEPSTTAPHPGEYLQDDFLTPRGITQRAFAQHIGVVPVVINDICRGKRGLTPRLAMMIAKGLGTELQFWLNAQAAYEYSREVKKLKKTGEFDEIQKIKAIPALAADE